MRPAGREVPARGLRAVLALPGYRSWAARTVSQWGDVVQTVTLALLVYELTGSGIGVAAVVPSMDVLWQTVQLVSLGLGAVLAEAVGISAVYLLGGLLLLLAAAVGLKAGRAVTAG